MGKYLLIAASLAALTSCGTINRLNDMIEQSTTAIHDNREAVECSTWVIQRNAQIIEESNRAIEENRRHLEKITQESGS